MQLDFATDDSARLAALHRALTGTHRVLTQQVRVLTRVLTGTVLLQVVLKGNGFKEADGSEREPMKYKRDCNCEAECCPQCRSVRVLPVLN